MSTHDSHGSHDAHAGHGDDHAADAEVDPPLAADEQPTPAWLTLTGAALFVLFALGWIVASGTTAPSSGANGTTESAAH